MRTPSLAGAVTFFALSPLLSAQTIVSGGGTALQQAINTAPLGAILDVMPGTYTPVTVTQGVRISLRLGAVVGPLISPPTAPPSMTVSALPAGQQFVVEGSGSVNGLQLIGCAGDILVNGINHATFGTTMIGSCTGAVLFHRTSCVNTSSTSYGTIAISNCAHVSFTACQLSVLTVSASRVSLSQSSNVFSYGSVPGIDLQSGSVVIDGGTIEGAAQFSFPLPHPGLRIAGGEVVATGGAVIRSSTLYPAPWIAIESTGGTIRLDPSVQLIGSVNGPVVVQTSEVPSLAVTHNATMLAVALTGEPGSALFTLAGMPMSPVPTPWGEAWLSPADVLIDAVIVPPSGAAGFSLPVANAPPFATLVVQSVALTSTGYLVIGAPARFAWD